MIDTYAFIKFLLCVKFILCFSGVGVERFEHNAMDSSGPCGKI